METAFVVIFLSAYWVINDFLEPEMCNTQIQKTPYEVWKWVECEDLEEIQDGNNLQSL